MSTTKIIVKNHGPDKSEATYVAFKGLDDVVVNAITPSVGKLTDHVWSIGELDVGAEASVIVDAEPKEGSISQKVEAVCYSSTKDANISNNNISFEVTHGASSEEPTHITDIWVREFEGEGSSDTKLYIDVGNDGPDVSEDTKLTFSDNIDDLTFESVSVSKGELDETLLVWNIGTLEVGEEAAIDFEGILNETEEDITLTATISGSGFDPNLENNVLVKVIKKSSLPEGFVIRTTDGVVAVIEGPGEVPGTSVIVEADGWIKGYHALEEVISWPDEKPDWLEGGRISLYYNFNLTKVPNTLPAWVTSTYEMFGLCSSFNGDVSGWDTSNVTNMSYMFRGCPISNQDLSGWDTSNVTDMSRMFEGCRNFNGDVSGWDTSNVTTMERMFYECNAFNQDISGWDTSNVTNMTAMFEGCESFNQDLSGWCVSNISSEPYRFSYNAYFWTLPKPVWGTCPQEDSGGGDIVPDRVIYLNAGTSAMTLAYSHLNILNIQQPVSPQESRSVRYVESAGRYDLRYESPWITQTIFTVTEEDWSARTSVETFIENQVEAYPDEIIKFMIVTHESEEPIPYENYVDQGAVMSYNFEFAQ